MDIRLQRACVDEIVASDAMLSGTEAIYEPKMMMNGGNDSCDEGRRNERNGLKVDGEVQCARGRRH